MRTARRAGQLDQTDLIFVVGMATAALGLALITLGLSL
jgi:hypothetical protein